MQGSLGVRRRGPALVAGALAGGMAVAGALALSGGSAAAPAAPQKTVKATRIVRPPRTLARGSRVRSGALGHRVFVNGRRGFALASVGQAQYPATTGDGGRTWRTDGPALHLNAAQAPLAVQEVGARGPRTVFAYGGGNVIDATSDGGRRWYRAMFTGVPMAVVTGAQGHLVAFVDGETGGAPTRQYVSKNGGRTWRYNPAIGGS